MERGGVVAFVVLALVACTKTEPGEIDQRDLKAAFALDASLDHALKQAEDEDRAGRDSDAIDILKRKAEPAANAAVEAANALAPKTAWGETEKQSLVAIETARRDELAHFESVLGGDNLDQKLAAFQKQLELEKRVMAVSAEIERGP